jgi:SET domain-containing protein
LQTAATISQRNNRHKDRFVLLIETEIGPSNIHGIGLFCVGHIPKGTKVWEFNPLFDQVLDDTSLALLPPPIHSFLSKYAYRSVESNELIVNLDLSRHMNHADHPNLASDTDSNYYAAVDLAPGTELTCDYREFAMGGCIDFLNCTQSA